MEKVQLRIGDIVKGIVKDTHKTLAHISLGDGKAILPSTEYSWSKDVNIKNVMKVGDEINAVVVVLSDDDIVLSIKRLRNNPWKDVDYRYVVGQTVKGKIQKVVAFGAFIELEDGLTGLLHKSEMPTDGTTEVPSLLTEGQDVEVEIMAIEANKKRMSFSIKSQV